jgi:hypothetical protein
MGGSGEEVYKHSTGERIGLAISVDWEHGNGMDHIAPESTTYSVTQVGHTNVLATVCIQ